MHPMPGQGLRLKPRRPSHSDARGHPVPDSDPPRDLATVGRHEPAIQRYSNMFTHRPFRMAAVGGVFLSLLMLGSPWPALAASGWSPAVAISPSQPSTTSSGFAIDPAGHELWVAAPPVAGGAATHSSCPAGSIANPLEVVDGWDGEMATAGDQPDAASAGHGLPSINRLRNTPPTAAMRNGRCVNMFEYL